MKNKEDYIMGRLSTSDQLNAENRTKPTPAVDELNLDERAEAYSKKHWKGTKTAFLAGYNCKSNLNDDLLEKAFNAGMRYANYLHKLTDYAHDSIHNTITDNDDIDFEKWVDGTSYTDSTHHNHASFVALVEGEIALLNNSGPNSKAAENILFGKIDILKKVLTKLKKSLI